MQKVILMIVNLSNQIGQICKFAFDNTRSDVDDVKKKNN